MIPAVLRHQALLDDIAAARQDTGGFHLWWLGQSGFLIQWQGRHLLIDPYLSDSLTRKYAETDKPHIRMSELVIDPSSLDFIDLVSSSHNHTDHLDAETLLPLIRANPEMQMIIPRANRSFVAQRIGMPEDWAIGLNEGESVQLPSGFTVHGIPAAHNELDRDAAGNCCNMGYVFQFGNFQVYHSGDTLWRTEIVEALRSFSIDVALLPINGNEPERRVAGNLNAREAVDLAQAIGAKWLIPCHYHMFTFNTVDPDAFIQLALQAGQAYRVLQGGERLTVNGSGN